MNGNRIVIITGGSFQGKSLLSLALAAELRFSGVLTTDAVRNVLRVIYPDKVYLGTSTYLLSKLDFDTQTEIVSDMVKNVLPIYENRGEHMIIEGMHFSSSFFEWVKEKDYCRLCLDNELAFDKRIALKGITRTKLRKALGETTYECGQKSDNARAKKTAYYQYRERIEEIHNTLLRQSKENNFHIVKFSEINQGIEEALTQINSYFWR